MARSKEACVIVLDVGRSMGEAYEGGVSGLESAKKAVRLMLQQKLLFTKQDEIGIVLCGTTETANQLNEETGEGSYEHISVHTDLKVPDLKMLESIEDIEVEEEVDVIDALLVAMGMIKSRVGKLKFEKRIFLVTDAAGPILEDEAAFDAICQGLVDDNFKLNVIGVGFSDEDDAEAEAEADRKRTETQVNNEKLLRRLADRVNGAVFSVGTGIDMLAQFRSKSVGQVSKFRGNLEIGPGFDIPVWTFAKTQAQNMPSLQKMSIPAEQALNEGKLDEDEVTMKVKMNRQYVLKDGDEETLVDDEDRARAYKYGKEYVPIPKTIDPDVLKWQADRSLKVGLRRGSNRRPTSSAQVLGFCPSKHVPRWQYMSGVDVVVAEPGNFRAGKALSALIHGLHELDQVALVRYVKRANSPPIMAILSPCIKATVECLYLNAIPFAEDVRDYDFASLSSRPEFIPNAAQLRAVSSLIDAMDLMHAHDGEEALRPKETFNPALQRFYQCLERRALDPTAEISELDPVIAKYVNPDEEILKRAAPAVKEVQENFTFTKVVEEKKRSKRHWRDYLENVTVDADIEAVKRQRAPDEQEDKEFQFDALTAARVDKIGAVDPVKDFEAMIARRDDPDVVARAIEQMSAMIIDLVKRSFGETHFQLALECVDALRKGAKQHEEADPFNELLRDVKAQFSKKKDKEKFWNMLLEHGVRPIDQSEVASSSLTPAEASEFMGKSEEPTPSVRASVDTSADMLFGDLE